VPKLGPDFGWSYLKFGRRAQDWATVGVAAVVRRTKPRRRLAGASPDAVGDAASAAGEGTSPPGDVNASPEFRQELARVLTKRALEEALSR
jgi:carbon-monoxide dehydrogenase medium subunit